MSRDVDNGQDVIDSRDVIARIESLESSLTEQYDKAVESGHQGAAADFDAWLLAAGEDAVHDDFDEARELVILRALAEECDGYASDWQHGETLIRRSYFVDYCEELCKDIGDLPKEIPQYIAIDWQKTADNLEADYTTVDFSGVEYLIQSC